MCQLCTDLVNKHFPNDSDEVKYDVVWNMTAFPFLDPHTEDGKIQFEEQLMIARKIVDGELDSSVLDETEEEREHRQRLTYGDEEYERRRNNYNNKERV